MKLKDQRTWRITRDEDEWCIRGKKGVIHQFEDGYLDVWVTDLRLSKRMERAGWEAKNHYDDGALFIRPYEDLNRACRWIQAKKRRVMSPKQLEVLARARQRSPITNP